MALLFASVTPVLQEVLDVESSEQMASQAGVAVERPPMVSAWMPPALVNA